MFKDLLYKFVDPYGWLNDVFDVLNPVLYAIMAVVGAAGAIYAIYLGVQLARAEDQSKRDEAKKRLITTLISVAVTIALVIFFTTLMPMILDAFLPNNSAVEQGKAAEILINSLK